MTAFEGYKILEIFSPWPKSETTFKYALVDKQSPIKINLNYNNFDGIIPVPVDDIVVTSTTHLPALELLEETASLIGFPGTTYVSLPKIRTRIDSGEIRELGKNEGINTEVLLELRPDVLIAFGIDGNNSAFETITNAKIPVIYNGDWVEESPLAKAEWIKLFGVLYDKEVKADSVFKAIEAGYISARELAKSVKNRPTVLSGAMHKDVWYLPSGTSPEGQLLKDANVDYLWASTAASGSLALNFETVFTKAQSADLWFNPSYYPSYEALEDANSHYGTFKAFKSKNIFTVSTTTGATGGVLYYEKGLSRPDLVLKDLIKIAHPELLQEYQLSFFKPLQ
ncbi:ABC transporter substrate-binding protein [Formosa sp. S-31]|uniref:ABC transporter substrate-binding protein n=1 Tax=Formosa sp. S-31 TaxID=2790949 RepID=UPI003EB7E0A4